LEQLAARVDQLEQAVAILAQGEDDGTGGEEPGPDENSPGMSSAPDNNDRAMVGDRAFTGNANMAFQEAVSRAELLVPGMRHPTFDARMKPQDVSATLCAFRRRTIDAALSKGEDGKDAVLSITGRPKNPEAYVKAMSCDAISVVFNGASEMIRTAGIRGGHNGAATPGVGTHFGGGTTSVQSVADVVSNINKVNRERYGIRK
jgi:hypothetical protein